MTTAAKTKSLYTKLAEVMAEVGYVQKKGYNSFHKYKYVTEQDLVEAVREKLAARNVVLIPSVVQIDERPVKTSKGGDSCVTTVRVEFTFCDGDSGDTHTATWAGAGDDPADKGIYKAYTGAMKYFLMKSFLIPTGDDPEADERTDERSANGQTRTPPPAPADPTISDAARAKIAKAIEDAGVAEGMLLAAAGFTSLADVRTVGDTLKIRAELDKAGASA